MKEGSLYVGKTSRTIYERSTEHWSQWRSRSEKSHIWRHQQMEHGEEEPNFVMRVDKTTDLLSHDRLGKQLG